MTPEEFNYEVTGTAQYERRLLKLMHYCQIIEQEDPNYIHIEQVKDTKENVYKYFLTSHMASLSAKIAEMEKKLVAFCESAMIGIQNVYVKTDEAQKINNALLEFLNTDRMSQFIDVMNNAKDLEPIIRCIEHTDVSKLFTKLNDIRDDLESLTERLTF